MYQATGSRVYTGKTRLRGLKTLIFCLSSLKYQAIARLYSRDF
ncbi:hypothetical protein [Nostoc spongiaeforme]|nr:hypothetical protein [Nostoc spongiaeforme]